MTLKQFLAMLNVYHSMACRNNLQVPRIAPHDLSTCTFLSFTILYFFMGHNPSLTRIPHIKFQTLQSETYPKVKLHFKCALNETCKLSQSMQICPMYIKCKTGDCRIQIILSLCSTALNNKQTKDIVILHQMPTTWLVWFLTSQAHCDGQCFTCQPLPTRWI